ncbi:S53 family peptidase [uncultured Shewanella sp.]|uniref:S53 family peptidase n=1 Tax=uncultured Shewanella sp. TaxID=173975 RepID=UPI00262898FA|nr:S53 family peptidase [uncultured Shewanella sp.]
MPIKHYPLFTFHYHCQYLVLILCLLLLGCNEENSSACLAPDYNRDGSLTIESHIQCYTPQNIHDAYRLNPIYQLGITGQKQHIILIDAYASPSVKEDLIVFHHAYFPERALPEINVKFPFGTPDYDDEDAPSWAIQSSVDSQWSHAIAPDANITMIVALSDDSSDLLDAIHYAIDHASSGSVVSLTFSNAETHYSDDDIDAFEAAFKQGTDKGLNFFAPAGTWGSDNRTDAITAVYPASSPYVISVGGTFLQYAWSWDPLSNIPYLDSGDKNPDYFHINSNPMQRLESVWNAAWLTAATGGGISQIFDVPDWQQNVSHIIDSNALNNAQISGRGYPDLAWHAGFNGGLFTYYDGNWFVNAGTSMGSPQVTAFFALCHQYLSQQGFDNIGLYTPWLYQIEDSHAYNDIIPINQGSVLAGMLINNQRFTLLDSGEVAFGDIEGYPTSVGWDLTTGFGSPNGIDFLMALEKIIASNQE